MNISLIAAIGLNNELGINNSLIWHFKEDLKYFKEITDGHVIVMGRKTFESLPSVLSNRTNIVISHLSNFNDQVISYNSIDKFIKDYQNYSEEIFIIGGESIYQQFIDIASTLYLTEIMDTYPLADSYFPTFDKNKFNKEIIAEQQEKGIQYKHVLYKRK